MVETEIVLGVGDKVILISKSGRDKHYKISNIENGYASLKGLFDTKDKVIKEEQLIEYVKE